MTANLVSAAGYSLVELSRIFGAAFENYFVPVAASPEALAQRCRMEDVDLAASQVLVVGGEAVGLALVAIRGRKSRLAAMGVLAGHRGKGLGRVLVEGVLAQAAARGDERIVLECIGLNEKALRLYEQAGFKKTRRLVGYTRPAFDPFPTKAPAGDLEELVEAVTAEGEADLPWQVHPATLAACGPGFTAYTLEGAWVLLNEGAESIQVRTILVPRAGRGRGLGTLLLRAAAANYAPKPIVVPSIMPEGPIANWYGRNGFSSAEVWQYEMERMV